MKQRILAAALACLLLAGCAQTPVYTAEEEVNGPVVAYVPLDDRPDNVERVEYLARSLGYDLQMPQADDYRTRLQGQPLNENGTQYGDRADLIILKNGGHGTREFFQDAVKQRVLAFFDQALKGAVL